MSTRNGLGSRKYSWYSKVDDCTDLKLRFIQDNALWERSLGRRNPSTERMVHSLGLGGCVGDTLGAPYDIKRKRMYGRDFNVCC